MKTWLKKGTWLKSAASLALPVALLLVILGGTLNANPAHAQTELGSVAADRAALVALYNATDGDNWTNNTNWLSDKPVGVWHGVTTRINDGRVTRLNLSENNLSGTLPAQLGDLNFLVELSLHRNQLKGQIPSRLADLDNLEWLHLSRNQLIGEIPAFLGGMTSLNRLHLNHNGFAGAVPAELGNRAIMTSLLLQSNPRLSGQLPQSLTGLTNLTRFHFQDTGLCYPNGSSLASWINGVSDVKGPDCDRAALVALYHATDGDNWTNNTNWLSDKPLAEWHGIWLPWSPNGPVDYIDLSNNNLTGTLPAELSNLKSLGILKLNGNNLTGKIPEDLNNVYSLNLSDNDLSGPLPSELFAGRVYAGYPFRFVDLQVQNNSGLTGPLPRSLMHANPAYELLYAGTGLCAPADAEFQNWLNNLPGIIGVPGTDLSNLVTLDQNCTDRQILTALYNDDVANADWIDKTNWLSDRPLGEWYGVTTNDDGRVTRLDLADNNLNGDMPDYLASLTELTELKLQRNGLIGQIPPSLAQLDNLEVLYLSRNYIRGPLPAELGRMDSLQQLHLNGAGLTGEVPAEWGNLTSLTSLLLHSNGGLSGELPQSLAGLTNVSRIHFQNTDLCAPLNAGFQAWLDRVGDTQGNNCANQDRAALVALYNATDGANWHDNTNWLSDRPVGEWYGIDTDNNGNVSVMLLQNNNLRGAIPAEMGYFANLQILSFNDNWLTGSIPAELGNLTSLTSLSLSKNLLVGAVPAELGNLTNLTSLSLYGNRSLGGTLPASLVALEQMKGFRYDETDVCAPYEYEILQWLEGMDLYQGEICGPVSERDVLTMFYRFTNGHGTRWLYSGWGANVPLDQWYGVRTNEDGRVIDINLNRNFLSGTIPPGFGVFTELESLILTNNDLSGEIPPELGNLSKLRLLWLHGNRMTGEIPPELGNLSNLTYLLLFDNKLSGEIPAELGNLSALTHLWLYTNKLTGNIPKELKNLDVIEEIDLGLNRLSGEIPTELGDLNNLVVLDLGWNDLTGAVPAGLGNLSNLTKLDLKENSGLTGLLPQKLTELSDLTHIHFNDTGLCAPLNTGFQAWLGSVSDTQGNNCTDRDYLVSLYNATNGANWANNANWLSGRPIGEWHGVTTDDDGRVTQLILRDNNLSGEIPATWSWLARLERLVLPNNALTGDLPEELALLPNLQRLNLTGNSLSGAIPAALGGLSNLERIYLDGNNLTGGIPAELGNLGKLRILILASNELSGEIPGTLGSLSALQHLILTNNSGLTGSVPTELGSLSNLQQLYLSHTGLSGALPGSLTGLSQLAHLHFGNSGLCAPADAGFQTWLGGVSDKQGSNCAE